MKCPRCEEGNIITVRFKNTGDKGSLCDICEALWFDGEKVRDVSGQDTFW